ncbi:uncharacterized protein LOC142231097 [Haematobia irritans]|uniref:uncharacterized protein LOC142231097 n=1 Tax=Haematobia irritans TaxID=7368 RepID=UPI003F50BD53
MTGNTSSSTDGAAKSSDLSRCMKKVKSIGKQLADINARLTDDEVTTLDDADLAVRLDYVESLNAQFDRSISTLEELSEGDYDRSIRADFLTSFFGVKAKIKRQLNASVKTRFMLPSSTIRQFSVDESTSVRRSILPELKIPKFSGSYTDWPDFFAMFTTVVANDIEISKLEKFQHLRASLVGPALDTISSLEPSDASYDEAIKLLKSRFDNKLLNFQTHIKEIFALKPVVKGSATSLRQLSDKLNARMRALCTMCSKEEIADGLLVHLVTTKLDVSTQAKWEESLQNEQLPSWSSMAAFLDRKCRMLENLEHSMTPKVNHIINKKSNNSRNALVASGSTNPICAFCDGNDHYITNCSRFSNLSPTLRFKEAKKLDLCLNCLRRGHRLTKCKYSPCRHCSMKHHTLLHMSNSESTPPNVHHNQPDSIQQAIAPQLSPTTTTTQSSLVSSNTSSKASPSITTNDVLLATAIVLAQLQLNSSQISIPGIGEGNFIADMCTEITVKACQNEYSVSFVAVVIPTITEYQPNPNIDLNSFDIPQNIKLADPDFYKRGKIDILIGAGLFFELMSVGQIRFGDNSPILQKTQLGWVVSGGGATHSKSCSLAIACKAHSATDNESLTDVMKSFWEVEQNFETFIGQIGKEEFCENHFKETTLRLSSGAYVVSLPKKEAISKLGESYDRAYNRFVCLEKKINKQPQIKEKYVAFMDEYSMLGHMSLVTNISKSVKTYFLPHHCVHKEDSTTTKLRVVFDGSAKTTTGFSLNDTLHSGPTIQPKLFDTLLRFRFFKIALSGDICKMYRCVHVSYPDDYLQCILWRNNPQEKIQIYKLNTVTYGTKPAAFLAIRAMHQLAADEEDSFPVGSKIVKRDFYVDDLISGGNSVEEVIEIRKQITELLKRGNFEIRKWCTNDSDVLDGVPATDRETFLKFHDGTDITKTLGLVWDPRSDSFIFALSHFMDSKPISKRTVLSSIARLYDPLGLVGPVITKAKVFMQNLWKGNLDWDETLPQLLHSIWLNYISSFSLVHKFVFPRFVYIPGSTIQVHAFCDASLSAYGTCVYVRSELQSEIKITLLCSKSRVAPLKALTVPKLELSAAALLADLLESITKTIGIDCEYYGWSDSMVVLSWLQEESSNYNVFVANRATHLELVHDLSTPSFLSSLKRFISIRGKPKTIWSDNATNFVGAKNELAELRQLFFDQSHMQEIYNQCTEDEIVWKFIPPRSPHFGGLWEAAVKSENTIFIVPKPK